MEKTNEEEQIFWDVVGHDVRNYLIEVANHAGVDIDGSYLDGTPREWGSGKLYGDPGVGVSVFVQVVVQPNDGLWGESEELAVGSTPESSGSGSTES